MELAGAIETVFLQFPEEFAPASLGAGRQRLIAKAPRQLLAGGLMVRADGVRNSDRRGCRSFRRSFPGTAPLLLPGRHRRALPDPAGTGSRPDGQWRGPVQRR